MGCTWRIETPNQILDYPKLAPGSIWAVFYDFHDRNYVSVGVGMPPAARWSSLSPMTNKGFARGPRTAIYGTDDRPNQDGGESCRFPGFPQLCGSRATWSSLFVFSSVLPPVPDFQRFNFHSAHRVRMGVLVLGCSAQVSLALLSHALTLIGRASGGKLGSGANCRFIIVVVLVTQRHDCGGIGEILIFSGCSQLNLKSWRTKREFLTINSLGCGRWY